MPAQIRDVALKAGVSSGTVSRVLNNTSDCRVNAETRARIEAAAVELGYRPNAVARGLRRKTATIGLMISGLRNPFFVDVLETAELKVRKAGFRIITDSAVSKSGTYGEHDKLSGWPVDAVLAWALSDQTLETYLGSRAREIPVVYMGYPRTDEEDWVTFDMYGGCLQAARYLLSQGRRRIASISPWENHRHYERHRACRDACAEVGLEAGFILTERCEETLAAGFETGTRLAMLPAGNRPDALMCHNDVIALGVSHGLRRAGVRVPADIAVVGYDGIEQGLYDDIALTTVVCSVEALCEAALQILRRRMRPGEESAPGPCKVTLPTHLRIGGTT